MTCQLCKEDSPTTKTYVRIDLGYETPVSLGFTAPVCTECRKKLVTSGIPKAKTVRLTI